MNLMFYKQAIHMLNRGTVLLCPNRKPVYFTSKEDITKYIQRPIQTSNNLYMFLWNPQEETEINELASELRGFDMYGSVIAENRTIYIENRLMDPFFPYEITYQKL